MSKQFVELNVASLVDFPIKETKAESAIEPEVVFDFYLFPKLFIRNDLVSVLTPYFVNNVELLEGAVELYEGELRTNYTYVYVIDIDLATEGNRDVNLCRNDDNSSLFFSTELVETMQRLFTERVLYRGL